MGPELFALSWSMGSLLIRFLSRGGVSFGGLACRVTFQFLWPAASSPVQVGPFPWSRRPRRRMAESRRIS